MRLAEFSVLLTTPITLRYKKIHWKGGVLIRGLKSTTNVCLFYNPQLILPANWLKKKVQFAFDDKENFQLSLSPSVLVFVLMMKVTRLCVSRQCSLKTYCLISTGGRLGRLCQQMNLLHLLIVSSSHCKTRFIWPQIFNIFGVTSRKKSQMYWKIPDKICDWNSRRVCVECDCYFDIYQHSQLSDVGSESLVWQ